jgi:hypothetical protein
MIKWDTALRERRLLSTNAFKQMWTPVSLNRGRNYHYGFGWVIKNVNGHTIVEHGGSWLGFQSFFTRLADDSLSVVVFGNSDQMDPARLAHSIAEAVEPKLKPRAILRSDNNGAAEIIRIYEALISGKGDRQKFTDALAKELIDQPNEIVEWASEEKPARQFFLLEEELGENFASYKFRIQHDALTFYLSVVINADGKISVFDMDQD